MLGPMTVRKDYGCLMMSVVQTLKKKIGEGSIGRVHLGRWQETDVAIKVRAIPALT